MSGKKFASPQEEIKYWRQQAEKFKTELEETKEELEEYQISSRELEQEMETQLEQLENKNRDFATNNSKLKTEVESLREKLESLQGTSHRQISELEDELAQVTAFRDELQKYIRGLEQVNDDLERAKRATVVSLEDFELRLNQAIERNAFLESELDEKETLVETVQRLKDEARDLRQELGVKVKTHDSAISSSSGDKKESNRSGIPQRIVDSNRLSENGFSESPKTHQGPVASTPTSKSVSNTNVSGGSSGTPLTPSARISALNIVGDLLRKVGALETKLASCRNYVKDQPRSVKTASGSPMNSPRTRRLNRGASVPQQGVKVLV